MDSIRLTVATLLANVAGLLFPIRDDIYGLVLLFTVNFIMGMLADVCNRREWSFKKALKFFRDAAVYFCMVASIYLLGHFKGEEVAAAHCVSFMIYVAIYFYGTNILRNARMLTNERSTLFAVLDFLYYLLSLRALEKNESLKGYFEHERSRKNMV